MNAHKKEQSERVAEARAEAVAAFRDNRCPCCGDPVRLNLSITGWVQCSNFGAVGFRARADKQCDWQGFAR